MNEKYTFDNLNLKLTTELKYYGNENHLWIGFQSASPYEKVANLEDLDGTRFKELYTRAILKFCKGRHFTYVACYPDSPKADNTFDITVLGTTNIDLERFTNNVNKLLRVQYQYLAKQDLIRRKEVNSKDIEVSISNDVLKRGVNGFDPELKDFSSYELKSDDEYEFDWIKIPTNVRAVKLNSDSILIYFGRYARIERTNTDGVSYIELTYDAASVDLEALASKKTKLGTVTKKTSPKAKTSKSKSKKSKSKEVDHDN